MRCSHAGTRGAPATRRSSWRRCGCALHDVCNALLGHDDKGPIQEEEPTRAPAADKVPVPDEAPGRAADVHAGEEVVLDSYVFGDD